MLVEFLVSGTAYEVMMASELAKDDTIKLEGEKAWTAYHSLKNAQPRKMGKGVTYRVITDSEAATYIAEYCCEEGERLFAVRHTDDPVQHRQGKALLDVQKRIKASMGVW